MISMYFYLNYFLLCAVFYIIWLCFEGCSHCQWGLNQPEKNITNDKWHDNPLDNGLININSFQILSGGLLCDGERCDKYILIFYCVNI